jgi:hypothetical protein
MAEYVSGYIYHISPPIVAFSSTENITEYLFGLSKQYKFSNYCKAFDQSMSSIRQSFYTKIKMWCSICASLVILIFIFSFRFPQVARLPNKIIFLFRLKEKPRWAQSYFKVRYITAHFILPTQMISSCAFARTFA